MGKRQGFAGGGWAQRGAVHARAGRELSLGAGCVGAHHWRGWGWLTYWKEPNPNAAFVAELWDRHEVLFRPELFPDVAAVRSKLDEIEKEQTEFVNGVTNESLQRMLPLRGAQIRLGHLMQHLANHSTYHRGQVALMMRQVGGKPLATDFHMFLVEGRNRAGEIL